MLAIANMADYSRNAGHQEEFCRHLEPLHVGKCGLVADSQCICAPVGYG